MLEKERPFWCFMAGFRGGGYLSCTSNFSRLGPAITPTIAKRIIERTPTAAAEGLNPPNAKVAKKFINGTKAGLTR